MKKLIITLAVAMLMNCANNPMNVDNNNNGIEMTNIVDTFTVKLSEIRNYNNVSAGSVISFNNTTDNYYPTISVYTDSDTVVYKGIDSVVVDYNCNIAIESRITKADSQQEDIGATVYLTIK